jgi:hypothetical protein
MLPADAAVCLPKPFEDMRQECRLDAGSRVANPNAEAAVSCVIQLDRESFLPPV